MKIGYVLDYLPLKYESCFDKVVELRPDKPLLIVGWKLAKEFFPNDFKVYNKQISPKIYWTYSRSQDFHEHELDLELFKRSCFRWHFKNFEFDEFDLLLRDLNTLNLNTISNTLVDNNIIYFRQASRICWINLNLADSLGLRDLPIFQKLYKKQVDDMDKMLEELAPEYRLCFY